MRCAILLVCFCLAIYPQAVSQGSPKIVSVEPNTGMSGTVATAKGENLGKDRVAELYLTDGKNDTKAVITDQSGAEIKFQVPKVAAGRYRLMLLNADRSAMREQPVVFIVE